MSQTPRRCTHCGVEARPEGQAEICWNCRGSLRPGEEGRGPEALPSAIILSWIPGWSMPIHWSILAIFTLVAGFLCISKGWLIFYAVPMWLVGVPALFLTRYIVQDFSARAVDWPSLPFLARLQFVSIVAFNFFLPGMGDGSTCWVFVTREVPTTSPLLELSIYLSIFAALVFTACTCAVFFAYMKNRPSRKPGKPAKLGRRPNQ